MCTLHYNRFGLVTLFTTRNDNTPAVNADMITIEKFVAIVKKETPSAWAELFTSILLCVVSNPEFVVFVWTGI